LIEASKSGSAGLVRTPEVATVATAVVRDVRTAVEPKSDASVAVGPSVVLRHEHDDRDVVVFGWCIGHSPSPWAQVQACSTVPAGSTRHSDTGAMIIADAWQRSHAPMIPLTCCRNLRIARLAYHVCQTPWQNDHGV
jgi:hypothetical protein